MMTNEEAISEWAFRSNHIKKWLDEYGEEPSIRHYVELIDMAIEALKILGDDGVVNCCGCIHWKTDGGAVMMCELWDTPMGDFDYCSYGKREKQTIPCFAESEEAYNAWTWEEIGGDGDEINEMNKEIIKDILKTIPTVYLLEALGVSTFEELTEQVDRFIKAIQDCRNCKYAKYNERYSEYFCYHNGECVNYDLWESGEEIADRPHGEWIHREHCQVDEDAYEIATCSHCNAEITLEYPYDNYCPNCGKRMKGGAE